MPVDQQGSSCLNTFGAVTITSPAGIAGAFVAEECPAFDCWKRFDVPFDAASWGVTQEAWSAILADVTSISIRVEAQLHDEATGLDNIALLPPGVANVDLSGDGVVGVEDVLILLGGWGPCGECCPADLDGDGIVGVSDVLSLLGGWG